MLIIGQDEAVAQWAIERIDHCDDFGPCAALGFAIDDEIKGAAVFNNLRRPDIEMSLVIEDPRICTKTNIRAVFKYCFELEKVARITALTAKSNKRSRKLIEGIGFTLEGRKRAALPNGEALMIYGFTKKDFDESKWSKYG